MNPLRLLGIAAANLIRYARRNLLIGGAIAGVVTLLLIAGGVSNGIRHSMFDTSMALYAGQLNVDGIFKPRPARAAQLIGDPAALIRVIRQALPDADRIVLRGLGAAKLTSDQKSIQDLRLVGVQIDDEPRLRRWLVVEEGSLDALRDPHSVVIFRNQAKTLGVKLGDTVTLTQITYRGIYNALDVKVGAIARDVGALSRLNILLPNAALRELAQFKDGSASSLQIDFAGDLSLGQLQDRQDRLSAALEKAGQTLLRYEPEDWMDMSRAESELWTGQRVEVYRWDQEGFVVQQARGIAGLDALSAVVGAILLLVLSIGLMNMLWLMINERRGEIGTLRAIGMSRLSVALMFLFEGLLLGLAAVALGFLVVGPLVSLLNGLQIPVPEAVQFFVGSGEHLVCRLNPGSFRIVGAVVVLSTTLFSLVPSIRAARIRPILTVNEGG